MNIFYFPGSSAFILLLCLGIDLMSGPLPEYISKRGFCICGLRQGGFVELPGLVSYFVYLRLCTFGIFSFSVLWSMWITCVEKKKKYGLVVIKLMLDDSTVLSDELVGVPQMEEPR